MATKTDTKDMPQPVEEQAAPASAISVEALTAALQALPDAAVSRLLERAGLVPTTAGMTAEQMQTLMMNSGAANARAMQLSLRKENPNYPEKSAFFPDGKYDDAGNQLASKVVFKRPTYFQGVRLGGELETPEEITLCNRFDETKELRDKQWKAEIRMHGNEERLFIEVPSRTVDERMNLPGSFSLILQELLGGSAAVNPIALQKQIDELRALLDKQTAHAAA